MTIFMEPRTPLDAGRYGKGVMPTGQVAGRLRASLAPRST
jgi:hypothetical protein